MALPRFVAWTRVAQLRGLPFLAKLVMRCLHDAVRTAGAPPARQMRTKKYVTVAEVLRRRVRPDARQAAAEEPTAQLRRTGSWCVRWLRLWMHHVEGMKLLVTISIRARAPRWTPLHVGNLEDQMDYADFIGMTGLANAEGHVSSTLGGVDASEVMFRHAREGRGKSHGLRLPMDLSRVRGNIVVAALGMTSLVPPDRDMTTEMMLISLIP